MKNLVAIDIQFGDFISNLSGGFRDGVFVAAALVSMATRDGHACLDLSVWAGNHVLIDDERCLCPELSLWLEELLDSPGVGAVYDVTPLVLDATHLYLRRYWEYENDIAEFIIARSEFPDETVDMVSMVKIVTRLFDKSEGHDWQCLASLAAVLRPFVVITGGPGTGKTTTITKIIALLIELHFSRGNFRIALAAPTGKAVMRLQSVMSVIRKSLACPEAVRELIPTKVVTLHRLLGSRKGSPFFKYNKGSRLPWDLIIVDEASMVDLPLMAKLMWALKPSAKLVLLGDHNQLASVEPGAVLADIYGEESKAVFSEEFLAKAETVTCVDGLSAEGNGLTDYLVGLQKSHRFSDDSGIYLVGRAVNNGDSELTMELLCDEGYPDVGWKDIDGVVGLRRELAERFSKDPPEWFGVDEPAQALQCLNSCQILCVVRQGGYGVVRVNRMIEEILSEKWGVVPGALCYPGRPVMVVENNYPLQLYNGDTGIILGDQVENEMSRCFFPASEGGPRTISLTMLPNHETAYAMTVHKSQGSEFDEVVLLLPDRLSPVLTRELIYTALTRARKKVEVWGRVEIFREAVKAEVSRQGGLRDKLRRVKL